MRTIRPKRRNITLGFLFTFALCAAGCGNGTTTTTQPPSPPPPAPTILNVNSSSDPSSPVGLAIEINGSDFGSAPGQVRFRQADPAIEAVVVPEATAWGDDGIVAVVPAGDGTNNFTVPGTVAVTVVTSAGTSNAVDLDLVETITFDVNNVTWATTTPLPFPMSGLRAVAVPVDDATAFVIVAGGRAVDNNVASVFSNSLAPDGQLGAAWTEEANALPSPRAHHGMAQANPGNSLLANPDDRFVYVIGGQEDAAHAPGGTSTVLFARVSVVDGSVGAWAETIALPEPLIGPAVAAFNGYVYVVGGLRPNGMPNTAVYSAPIQSGGTLGAWATSPNPYPVGTAFAVAFGFGGKLYVLGGDPLESTDPNAQGMASETSKETRFARARRGEVGPWTSTEPLIKQRKKHIAWSAFGQVIAAEGVYEGLPGSLELERSAIQADGTLAAWNGITAEPNQINANVYNAAAIVSPLQSPTGKPRFLLLGGQAFTQFPPGALQDTVYYNNAP